MSGPLRALIIEDSEDDAKLLLRALRRGGFDPSHQRVETAEAMDAALQQTWDVVISDWAMPHFSGLGNHRRRGRRRGVARRRSRLSREGSVHAADPRDRARNT